MNASDNRSTCMELTERGLQRRIKRHLNGVVLSFAAITIPGFESIARQEIERLEPACVTGGERGIVEFCGTMELLYNAHIHLRTVNRMLFRITHFTTRSYPELYRKACRIKWELYCGFTEEIAFTVSSRASRLHHTEHIAATVFSSIHDHMRKLGVTTRRVTHAAITIFIRFCDDQCSVSIDATGALLYKRGYRTAVGRAPLRETTAASLLHMASWDTYRVIADPCCGSGSIIIEALHMACNHPSGLDRSFAFFSWPSFNIAVWERLKKNAQQKDAPGIHPERRLIANDIDEAALHLTRRNLQRFTCPNEIALEVTLGDCCTFNSHGEYGDCGLLISNLPFGKRITPGAKDCTDFYRKLGEWMRCYCQGWNFAFLVADPFFEQKVGMACRTVCSFSYGGIPVRFVLGHINHY